MGYLNYLQTTDEHTKDGRRKIIQPKRKSKLGTLIRSAKLGQNKGD